MSISKSAETHPLTWRIDKLDGRLLDLKTYESLEGFAALRKALKEMSPQDVQWARWCRFSCRHQMVAGANG